MPSKKPANMKLTIDPEFRDLIPPLHPSEKAALENSILTDGCKDPITVWLHNKRKIVIDGHNRYEICSKHKLPFTIVQSKFENREAVKVWMLAHQTARRNLTPDQVIMLHVMNGRTPPSYSTTQLVRAQTILDHSPELARKVTRGEYGLSTAYNLLTPKTPKARNTRVTSATADNVSVPTSHPLAAPVTAPTPTAKETIALHRAKAEAKYAKASEKKLKDRILKLEESLEFMHSAAAHEPVIHEPSARPKSGLHIADPVFMVSDTHFGEVVTLDETLGVNEYNLEIAAKRMAECWDNMLWLRKDMARTNSCDNTILNLNGDMVTGDIHDELRETNEGGLRTQCDACVTALAPGILAMADATPGVLHIVCIGGNHGRLTHKQHIKNGTEHSIEHIGVYDRLRKIIGDRGGKIAWHIPAAERFKLEVMGHRIGIQHGTMIRSGGGIGGVLVPMTRWVTRTNDADLYLFGHFHEADAYGKVIKNGSLIGQSAYGKWLGVEDRDPEQVAFLLSALHKVRRFERVSVT